jgi:hypothetical protein
MEIAVVTDNRQMRELQPTKLSKMDIRGRDEFQAGNFVGD